MQTPYTAFLTLLIVLGSTIPTSAQPPDKTSDPALELYFTANAAYNRKLYPIAAGNFEKFIAQYSSHPKLQLARYGLGLSQFALKQYDRAVNEFRKLLDEKKLDAKIARGQLALLHAQCLLSLGKQEEAQARLIAASSNLKPGVHRTGATAAVADLFFQKKDWEKTVIWAKKTTIANPTPIQNIRAGYQEGFAQYKLEKYAESIQVLKKTRVAAVAAKSSPWTTRLDYLLGECYVADGKLDLAETSLQQALAGLRADDAANAQYRLGTVKFSLKKWEEAQADFQVFLADQKNTKNNDPRIREAKLQVARCLMEQDQVKKADQKFNDLGQGDDEVAARAYLWRGRLYSRENKYGEAANALRGATDKDWYKKGFKPKKDQRRTAIVADIDFEYANALMLQKNPNWELALKFLARIDQRRRDYPQMGEVLNQQAICQHKLKQFNPSLQTTDRFIREQAKHELIGDILYLRGENLFLLNRLDESIAAYTAFLSSQKTHDQRLAAEFRIAQVYHHKQQWAESNQRAVPLLAKKPEGKLFEQLSFVVGENYFRLGKWPQAVAPFQGFLSNYIQPPKKPNGKPKVTEGPNVDTAIMQLGVALVRLDKMAQAIDQLELLVNHYNRSSPHRPLALSEQGKLLYDTGDLKRARGVLESFVNSRSDKNNKVFQAATGEVGRVHYYLGWIDSKEDHFPQAAEHFKIAAANSGNRKAKDGNPLAADASLQQGIALVNANDFENAAKHLNHVGNQYRDHPRRDLILYYTGLAYARAKNWGSASGFFKRVLDEHPKAQFADKAAYEWAWCERSMKRNKEATQRYELLLKQYPQSTLATKVQSELAELNLDVGAQDAVIAKLSETMKTVSDPDLKFELQYQLASAHFKKMDYENSATMFEALIERGQKSKLLPSLLFQAGESRLSLTESVPAREHFLAAHKAIATSDPLAESILLRLAETQNLTQQYEQAQASYQKFIRQFAQSQWIRNAAYGMAYALEKQEDYKKAIDEYSKLLSVDPKKPRKMDKWMVQARYQTGECWFNLQNYDKAMTEFLSVEINAKGYPGLQAKALLEMGRILITQNKNDEAKLRMQDVIKRFPKTNAAKVALTYLDKLRLNR